jgi:glycosyltransferase involved in cell wall biosynthesis
MASPRFSVVIPTRERAGTLLHTLKTCIRQTFSDYEIIVCDNHSSPATKQVVDEIGSDRIKYIRAPEPLAMSANWELALEQAKGEWVTVLGDDDGLMPYALGEVDNLVRKHPVKAVHTHRGLYLWPDIALTDEANFIRIPMSRTLNRIDSKTKLIQVCRFESGADQLPMIYNSFIHRDLITEMRKRVGKVFPNAIPDVYSGFAFAHLTQDFLSVGIPFNIAGLSGRSNGVMTLLVRDPNEIAEEFHRLNKQNGYRTHRFVPDLPVFIVPTADSFFYAKEQLFGNDPEMVMDRLEIARRCLSELPDLGYDCRREAIQLIRQTLADQPELQRQFDQIAPTIPPASPFRFHNAPYGYDGFSMNIDAKQFEIQNIADAVEFTSKLLGYEAGKVVYNLPDVHSVHHALNHANNYIANQQNFINRLQRETALRYFPLRILRKLKTLPARILGRFLSRSPA